MGSLRDGLETFNEDAIQKVVDYVDNDLGTVSDRAHAMVDLMRDYGAYAGNVEGRTAMTQFLIKTEGVEEE